MPRPLLARSRLSGDNVGRLVVLPFMALLVVASVTWPLVSGQHQLDLQTYYNAALKLRQGQLPYRDFPLEYPPLALVPFLLPRFATLERPPSLANYTWLWFVQSIFFSLIIAIGLGYIAVRWQAPRRLAPVLIGYALCVGITAPLLPWRYDLFPAGLTLLAVIALLASLPMLAGLCLALGVAAKLYPLVLLPVFGCYYLASKNYRGFMRLIIGFVGASVAILLPFYTIGWNDLTSFLRYHQERGLQVETLPAGLIILGYLLGWPKPGVQFNYGALHLDSPLASALLPWQPVALCLMFGLVLAVCFVRFREEYATIGTITSRSLVSFVLLALLAFIVTNKVFSPQYIIWLLPFAPLLRPLRVSLILAIYAMTMIIFPFMYDSYLAMDIFPVLILNLRNVLMVVLLLWLLMEHLPSSAHFLMNRGRMARSRRNRPEEQVVEEAERLPSSGR